ncbi:hypothetical protein JB92DRAFT_3126914 [Gautieria morchelliformis]|nr:hypothetical protein JB92DRAFT_3126914 [Gautieria morchelliformis]
MRNVDRLEFEEARMRRYDALDRENEDTHDAILDDVSIHKEARPQMGWVDAPDGDDYLDREVGLKTFNGMRELMTAKEEKERVIRELDDMAEYMDQILLPQDPDLEEEDLSVPHAVAGMDGLDLEDSPIEQLRERVSHLSQDSDWYPYENKTLFLLDLLDNLPRLRLSQRHMQMFLWVLSESGAHDVPSLYALCETQARLRKFGGVTTKRFESSLGNVMYLNDIPEIIAHDYANPQIAPLLCFYPEEKEGCVSEIWQMKRIKELPAEQLTPMVRKGLKDFYVNELAELRSGEYVIPHMWIIRNNVMCADARRVELTQDGLVVKPELVNIQGDDLAFTYFDLMEEGGIKFVDDSVQALMPNPLRAVANGYELYTSFVFLWADDVGGNVSKMVNAHKNIYLAHVNVPGRLLQQEYFVCFVATSPHASTPEQFEAVLEMFRIAVPGLPADNPQQSEECSHIGPSGNCKCRRCLVGGPATVTESDDGYHALHEPGAPRRVVRTIEEIQKQLLKATEGKLAPVSAMQTAMKAIKADHPSWSHAQVQQAAKEWLDEQPGQRWSPLLSFPGLDPHRDTPVEILHTVLLGLIKYVWHNLHTSWKDPKRELFIIRLQGTNIDGLTILPIHAAYMSQYRNALVGKHFKTLMQTVVFHVHGIVSQPQFELIKATGWLGAVLWYHKIRNMVEYLVSGVSGYWLVFHDSKASKGDLRILVANVLDVFDTVDLTRILDKGKLHILSHLPDDVEHFGPAIRNHQAPGRDIARKCSSMEHVKHLMSGGFSEADPVDEAQGGEWVQSSRRVQAMLVQHPIMQTHLGWVPPPKHTPGYVKPIAQKKRKTLTWANTPGAQARLQAPPLDHSTWHHGIAVTAQSNDICKVGTWVFAGSESATVIGRIHCLLIPEGPSEHCSYVILEVCYISDTLHVAFNMPLLRCLTTDPEFLGIRSQDIRFMVNVQHDCRTAKCGVTGSRVHRQEREATSHTSPALVHADDMQFVLNLNAIHNADLVRETLPRTLTAPEPLHQDRRSYHDRMAAQVWVMRIHKRAQTKAKAKATRSANKEKQRIAARTDHDENPGNPPPPDEARDIDPETDSDGGQPSDWNPLGTEAPAIDADEEPDYEEPDLLPALRSTRARAIKRRRVQ